jgi:hypothetical protein
VLASGTATLQAFQEKHTENRASPDPEHLTIFQWDQGHAKPGHDWSVEHDVLAGLSHCDGIILRGFSPRGLESLFRLRALQLAKDGACLEAPSVVFIETPDGGGACPPSLYHRVLSSWPFRSVIFVADGEAGAALASAGLPVLTAAQAAAASPDQLLRHPQALVSQAAEGQAISVQIQPLWGQCGSSTAFANQIECLNERGAFTIRIFLDHDRRWGETLQQEFTRLIPENTLDSAPCGNALAAPTERVDGKPANDYEIFRQSVGLRTRAVIHDEVLGRLAARADTAIVNHATSVGFAIRACPNAKLILDTHDYLTRAALERARSIQNTAAFPDHATLRRHAELESQLWQAADVCTAVSLSEDRKISRYAAHSLIVFPQPYVKPWSDPGDQAEWDVLIVADQHLLNVHSVSWFLQDVVEPNAALHGLRIGIVGQVRRFLEADWKARLPNVKWMGFVEDLDRTRNLSRITVCPDRAGTGISVKTLSTLAAGQATVATTVALRGMPPQVLQLMPARDSAEDMAADILALLSDGTRLKARAQLSGQVYDVLKTSGSYAAAIALANSRGKSVVEARHNLMQVFGSPPAKSSVMPDLEVETVSLSFQTGGGAEPFLLEGWHDGEDGGRWMDGRRASIRLPASWFRTAVMAEISFRTSKHDVAVTIECNGRVISPPDLSTERQSVRLLITPAMIDEADDSITLTFNADSVYYPNEHGESADRRILGAGIRMVSLWRQPDLFENGSAVLNLSANGNARAFLGDGWHPGDGEGRWMAGRKAWLSMPASWFGTAVMAEISFRTGKHDVAVTIECNGCVISPPDLSTERQSVRLLITPAMIDEVDKSITLTFNADSVYYPNEHGESADRRILGAGIRMVSLWRQPDLFENGSAVLNLSANGNALAFLGDGWHPGDGEGRWMDGRKAWLSMPASWFAVPATIEIALLQTEPDIGFSVLHHGKVLSRPGSSTRKSIVRVTVDESMRDGDNDVITLDFVTDASFCPHDIDGGPDHRSLGASIRSVTVLAQQAEYRGEKLELQFGRSGEDRAYLDDGWYYAEPWGRWTEGEQALLRLPASWFDRTTRIEIGSMETNLVTGMTVLCGSRAVKPSGSPWRKGVFSFLVDPSMTADAGDTLFVTLIPGHPSSPKDRGDPSDDRILGLPISHITLSRPPYARLMETLKNLGRPPG